MARPPSFFSTKVGRCYADKLLLSGATVASVARGFFIAFCGCRLRMLSFARLIFGVFAVQATALNVDGAVFALDIGTRKVFANKAQR